MPASEPPDCRAGLRVLLVEDENLVALLLEDMLAELGHTVVGPVARLDKALEMAQRERSMSLFSTSISTAGRLIRSPMRSLRAASLSSFQPATARRACANRIAIAQLCRSRSSGTICKSYSRSCPRKMRGMGRP